MRLSEEVFNELDALWQEGEEKDISFYEPYYEKVVFYQKKIEQVLDCPDITNIKWIGTLKEEHQDPFKDSMDLDNEYLMRFSCPIAFDVYMPISVRKYAFTVRYNNHLSTQFRVIYNGIVFLAYSEVTSSITEMEFLGPEIREYLAKQLSCDWWMPVPMPPCPLRRTFYVLSKSEQNESSSNFYEHDGIIKDTGYESDKDEQAELEYFYFKNEFLVSAFAELMSRNNALEISLREIQEAYSEICKDYTDFIFKTKHRRQNRKQISASVFQLYEALYCYDKDAYDYTAQEKLFKNLALSGTYTEELVSYCISDYTYSPFPQENIKNGLAHINNELSYRNTNRYVLLAAIIGAIAGFVGALLSVLLA